MALRLTAALALALGTAPALASGVVPLAGVFGDEAGCRLYLSGIFEPDDGLAVITPFTFTADAARCHFETVVSQPAIGVYNVSASCAYDDASGTAATVSVVDRGGAGIFVAVSGSSEWGPLFRCPGTEALFEPPGTQV